uniref:Uncharacterized protein n=1 Tax=Vespula pensylvanica TaxID=30213 RepID=A0A834PFW5_VESPE|nr:hypothetical protein H0235_001286 [Vespula pensylvanica]
MRIGGEGRLMGLACYTNEGVSQGCGVSRCRESSRNTVKEEGRGSEEGNGGAAGEQEVPAEGSRQEVETRVLRDAALRYPYSLFPLVIIRTLIETNLPSGYCIKEAFDNTQELENAKDASRISYMKPFPSEQRLRRLIYTDRLATFLKMYREIRNFPVCIRLFDIKISSETCGAGTLIYHPPFTFIRKSLIYWRQTPEVSFIQEVLEVA